MKKLRILLSSLVSVFLLMGIAGCSSSNQAPTNSSTDSGSNPVE